MYRVEVIVVPLVIGDIGTVPNNFANWQKYFGIPDIVGSAQISAFLAKAHVFRKVLDQAAGRS